MTDILSGYIARIRKTLMGISVDAGSFAEGCGSPEFENFLDLEARIRKVVFEVPAQTSEIRVSFCPECGCEEYKIGHGGSPNEHECKKCGQSWWKDVDYTNGIRANLAERFTKWEIDGRVYEPFYDIRRICELALEGWQHQQVDALKQIKQLAEHQIALSKIEGGTS